MNGYGFLWQSMKAVSLQAKIRLIKEIFNRLQKLVLQDSLIELLNAEEPAGRQSDTIKKLQIIN